jgi:predicted TIM-barrel fold metal-dependent hydrolase
MQFPAEYMFKNVPKDLPTRDPIAVTLHEMDRFGIAVGLIGVADDVSRLALEKHRDRFVPVGNIDDPNDVTGTVRAIRRQHEEFGTRAVSVFPAGTFPQVAIDAPQMYPVYQTCVDLGLPIFCTAGVPGPRLKYAVQEVSRIDAVMYDFPELVFVTRHGCEPWQALAVKLMLKWPNLYYSTSAFAPKHYPREIIGYANTRGADKIIYGGYFPMGLSLERIFSDMPRVPFKDEVWPKFLGQNARRVLKLDR